MDTSKLIIESVPEPTKAPIPLLISPEAKSAPIEESKSLPNPSPAAEIQIPQILLPEIRQKTEYTSTRYVVLISFCVILFISGASSSFYSTYAAHLVEIYESSLTSINGIYIMYLLAYLPSSILIHYPLSQKFGNRGPMIIAFVLMMLVLWLRVGVTGDSGLGVIQLSCFFGGIAFALYLNEIPRVVYCWFQQKQREIINIICVIMLALGMAFGYLLPMSYLSTEHIKMAKEDSRRLVSKEALKKAAILWGALFTPLLVICTIPLLLKPPVQNFKGEVVKGLMAFFYSFIKLISNGNFMLLTIVFVVINWVVYIIYGNLAPLFLAFSIQPGHAAGCIILLIIGGILGSFFHDRVFKNDSKRSLSCITISSVAIFFCFILFMYAYSANHNGFFIFCVYFLSLLFGFCALPAIYIVLDFGCELADPVPAASCNGIMIALSVISSMIGLAISGVCLHQQYPEREENAVRFAFAFCLALVAMLTIAMIMGCLVVKRLIRERDKQPKLWVIPALVMSTGEEIKKEEDEPEKGF